MWLVSIFTLYPYCCLQFTGYWEDVENQRRFFDDLAAELNFDPLVAENWLQVKAQEVAHRHVWMNVGNVFCLIFTREATKLSLHTAIPVPKILLFYFLFYFAHSFVL